MKKTQKDESSINYTKIQERRDEECNLWEYGSLSQPSLRIRSLSLSL